MLFNTFILIFSLLKYSLFFISIIVFSSASQLRCYLVFISPFKLSFMSHRPAVHLYSQVKTDVLVIRNMYCKLNTVFFYLKQEQ